MSPRVQGIVCHGNAYFCRETDLVPFSLTTQVFICVQLCIYIKKSLYILNFYNKCMCCVVFLSFFKMCVCVCVVPLFISPNMKTNNLTSSMWQSPF